MEVDPGSVLVDSGIVQVDPGSGQVDPRSAQVDLGMSRCARKMISFSRISWIVMDFRPDRLGKILFFALHRTLVVRARFFFMPVGL